jgi:tetratricopeptide (TPR) repeat protein
MRQFVSPFMLRLFLSTILISLFLPSNAFSKEFCLKHASGNLYGPFELKAGTLIGSGSRAYEITDITTNSFTLKLRSTGLRSGPFSCQDGTVIKLGDAFYTILTTNLAAQLQAKAKDNQQAAEQRNQQRTVSSSHDDENDDVQSISNNDDPIDRGVRLGNSGRYDEAVTIFRQAAKEGSALGRYNLGASYMDGLGVEQDTAKATYWYALAAEQGLAVAQTKLGLCYYRGIGVAQNKFTALDWFQKAAGQGNMDGITCYKALQKEFTTRDAEYAKSKQDLRDRGMNPDDIQGNMEILKRRVEGAGLRW